MKTMEETSIENYPISTYDALMIFPYLPIWLVVFRHPSETVSWEYEIPYGKS